MGTHAIEDPPQLDLLGEALKAPQGLRYQVGLLSTEGEKGLLERLRELPFEEFEFQGFTGKRRVVSFGWHYDFNDRVLRPAEEMPAFLVPLREAAADLAGLPASALEQLLLIEYGPGAGIGWHRDKGVFGDVVGVSLLSPCRFRMRRKAGEKWERFSFTAEPRSAYLLRGPARTEWEHSIPHVDALRYSVTFRTLRKA